MLAARSAALGIVLIIIWIIVSSNMMRRQ